MDIYIILAIFISFLWGIQPIIHKHLLNKYNSITIMLSSSIVYCSLTIILSIYKYRDVATDIQKLTSRDIGILVGLPIFTIFMANVIYYYILKNHESSIISALVYSSPAFTLIIAYLLLNERLNLYGLLGIFAIIIGVILISMNNHSSKQLEFFLNK